jgi:hypothetical protein
LACHERLVGAAKMKSAGYKIDQVGRFYLLVVLTAQPSLAFAYTDPGSGMLLIQGLVAGVGAIIVFVKNPISTIKKLIAKWLGRAK